MRSLTAAEARVIHALLVTADVTERRREEWAGVPRATFLAVRKRAFSHGWLTSRYVPEPAALGLDRITFVLDQPFSDRLEEAVREAREAPGAVLVWSSPETVLSVRFEASDAARSGGPPSGSASRHRFEVRVSEPTRQVPIYFDFEGAWSLWVSGLALVGYPAGLPHPSDHARPRDIRGGSIRARLSELLASGDGTALLDGSPLRLSDAYLSRRQRALVRNGVVARRVFPNLGELPPKADGASLGSCVFVHGVFRPRAEVEQLLPNVLREARVRPFLFTTDDRSALLGLLAPMPSRLQGIGRPLLEVLSESLESISVIREPIATLYPLIDHRYDRLVRARADE